MKKFSSFILALMFGFSLFGQNIITTDSVIQTSPCAGSQIVVPYSAGGSFPFGNQFIAQLSNNFGQFTSPINIGQSFFNIGYIFATIPQNTSFGFLYKIRVISTSPAVTGSASPNNIIITSAPEAVAIVSNSGDTLCAGDSTNLSVLLPGQIYQWSTGDTTQSIQVSQSGSYTVEVTDLIGCTASDTIGIVFMPCTGVFQQTKKNNTMLLIYPNPTEGKITIQNLNSGPEIYNVEIYNILQKKIYSFKLPPMSSQNTDLSGFSKGVYFIKVYADNESHQWKVIVR